MTFDRLWSVYLENKLKIKRNKRTVTILIFIVLSFVFTVDQIYMVYYVQNTRFPVLVFNQTLNKSYYAIINIAVCVQINSQIILAQNLIIIIMRIILPFIIMVACNFILINHIRKSRNRVIRGRNEKKNHSFTLSVAIMNAFFLMTNIEVVIYYIIYYYIFFNNISTQTVSFAIISLYGTCSIILSYLFPISQFLIDMIFNKIFRKEIIITLFFLTGRRNQIEETRAGNTNTNT